jgi:hypothetical protein
MTNNYYGNSMPGPGYAVASTTVNDELMYSMVGYTQHGVTLEPGQGVLLLGAFIKQNASTKMYVAAANGSGAEGVLRQTTDTGTDINGQRWQANIVEVGMLKLDKVQAANSSGLTLTGVLGARINTVKGFFKF